MFSGFCVYGNSVLRAYPVGANYGGDVDDVYLHGRKGAGSNAGDGQAVSVSVGAVLFAGRLPVVG